MQCSRIATNVTFDCMTAGSGDDAIWEGSRYRKTHKNKNRRKKSALFYIHVYITSISLYIRAQYVNFVYIRMLSKDYLSKL